ncbi:hypothetical protein [Leeuwenhoekiella sp. H156]|uniref:hypothetical protein n=1 Tax=Leeuwenhoekiella sp. H156 TaxID=3450128 RepID=UPI003FA46142
MKTGIVLVTLVLFTLLPQFNAGNVYICKGKSSKKYHFKKNCRGLSNCSTDVSEVSLEEAKKLGRGLCGWED